MKYILSLVVFLTVCSSVARAHAHLESAAPVPGAALKTAPASLRLNFSEAVNSRFSIFKVYPLALSAKPMDTAAAANRLEKSAIMAHGDAALRADTGVHSSAGSSITVALKPGLRPGVYVVLWKVMAEDDGHVTQGDYTFTVTGSHPTVYACPMHPQEMGIRGGVHCPKCGMKMIPVKPSR